MPLEPTKHVNGRMTPGVSGNPNGRPLGSRSASSAGFARDKFGPSMVEAREG